MENRAKPIHFRPTQKNRVRLEMAQKLGFEMTEVVNALLEKHFDSYVAESAKKRIEELQNVLATR